jgi:hypothetical protein
VNGWLYYSPGTTDWEASLALEPVAERTLATQSWREVERWYDQERPLVLEQNLALQKETWAPAMPISLGRIDRDRTLRCRCCSTSSTPGSFRDRPAARASRVGDRRREVIALLAGASPAIGGAEPPRRDRGA